MPASRLGSAGGDVLWRPRRTFNLGATGPVVYTGYDGVVMAEPGLLYYFPLGTAAGTEELVANHVLTKNPNNGPNFKAGALPNGDNAWELVGTNTVAPSSGYFSRVGEAGMGIQAGMVLEVAVKRNIAVADGPIYASLIQVGSWYWYVALSGANLISQVWAPGGQQTSMTATAAAPAVGTWALIAMRVLSVNSVGFNASDIVVNGIPASVSQFNQGGMGTPGAGNLLVGATANGGTGGSTYVAKSAVYSSLSNARLLAHATALGLGVDAQTYDARVAADGPPVDLYKFNDGSAPATWADTYPATNGTVALTNAGCAGVTDPWGTASAALGLNGVGSNQGYRPTIAGDKACYNNGTNGRGTIELLFHTGTLPGANACIASVAGFNSGTGYYCWELRVTASNTLTWVLYQQGGGVHGQVNGATVLAANTWYHVGLVVDKDAGTPYMRLLLNGVLEGQATSFTSTWYQIGASGFQFLCVGARPTGAQPESSWGTLRASRLAVYTTPLADATLLGHAHAAGLA